MGIWAPNRFEWVIAQYASARVGAILVNINPAYKAAELRYALRQSTRGYHVMLGYWEDEAATRKAIDAAGWMHTGDLATMDDEGYVKIVGRIKNMIIRGGENVSPREIEELLHTHPDVLEAQVIGVPSERDGEEVMAWVRIKPGCLVTATALEEYSRNRNAGFKVPAFWRFVDAFPMTVTGKVQKFRMRETAIVELGVQKAAGIATA